MKTVLFTVHVLAGTAVGAALRNPVAALAAGFASHFVLDAVPHWGISADPQVWLAVARIDGVVSVIAVLAAILLLPRDRRVAGLMGAVGAALPDLDKPARELLGRTVWPPWLQDFHAGIQHESLGYWWVDLAALVLALSALLLLRRR